MGPLRQELRQLGIIFPQQNHGQPPTTEAAPPASSAPAPGSAVGGGSGIASGFAAGPAVAQRWTAANVVMGRNTYARVEILGVGFKPRPCVMVSVALPPGHRAHQHQSEKERVEFWKRFGQGTLASDALVCLAMPSTGAGRPPRLVFATVVRRDPEELAMEQPVVGLAFEPGADVEGVLQYTGRGPLPVLVQVSSNLLSSKVLRCLQSMSAVPLAEELVHARPPEKAAYMEVEAVGKYQALQ